MWPWRREERWIIISYYIHCLFPDDEKYRQRLNERFFYGIRDFQPCDVWCPYSVLKPWWNLGLLLEAMNRAIFIHSNNHFDFKLSSVTIWRYVNSMFSLGLHIGQSSLLNSPYGFNPYLLTWRIGWAPNNASKWHMGFNSAFKELK